MERIIFSPSTYIQGEGEIRKLALHYGSMGRTGIYLLEDRFVHETYGKEIRTCFENAEFPYTEAVLTGECCEKEIRRHMAGLGACDVVAGIGGGKAQDTAKAVGFYSNRPVMVVPTAASSDAPCSRIAVLYQEDGTFDRYLSLKTSPNMVIMDTGVIAHAPVRLFAAGIGDALSTYYETTACARAGGVTKSGGHVSKTALALAEACLDTILTYGLQARDDVAHGLCTEAVECIVEANTYLSGIGFESGGLAGAHALANGLALLKECGSVMHGEKVAFCTLVQMILEERPDEEIGKIRDLIRKLSLPSTLQELGLGDAADDRLLVAANRSCSTMETMNLVRTGIRPEDVLAVMKMLVS